ncbi:hypothetical protein AB4Y38_38975 [Paraburkholderia sp. EG285A]|uniref:hypothetical protein n=1 Tax=Paraburkholderia sp. EG285A TaxID=3237009 RepID=UPI0034D2F800
MDDELKARIGVIAGKLVQEVMASGLTWDDAAAALGLAAKAAAQAAAGAAHGPAPECVALARRRFEDAFAQDVRAIVADGSAPTRDAGADENPLLATARRRQASKLH